MERPPPISAATLVDAVLPPPHWILPGILPVGLAILAGKPKVSKSWLSFQIALQAARSMDVLALALEDPKPRVQSRLQSLRATGLFIPSRLHVASQGGWARLNEGGGRSLKNWVAEYPATKLIIIDTLAKIRPPATGNVYEGDYRVVSGLKELADRANAALLIIHHLRKAPDEGDPFNEISGSVGISGAADTLMVLKRDRFTDAGVLAVTGRDIEERELPLVWDAKRMRWYADFLDGARDDVGAAAPPPLSEAADHIVEYVNQHGVVLQAQLWRKFQDYLGLREFMAALEEAQHAGALAREGTLVKPPPRARDATS